MSSSDMKRQAKALKDIHVILNTRPMFSVWDARKVILKILFCENTPTANQTLAIWWEISSMYSNVNHL